MEARPLPPCAGASWYARVPPGRDDGYQKDPLIPVRHARDAHERIPGSRLEIFAGAGHFPHRDDPERFAEVLLDFLQTTRPLPMELEPDDDATSGRRWWRRTVT